MNVLVQLFRETRWYVVASSESILSIIIVAGAAMIALAGISVALGTIPIWLPVHLTLLTRGHDGIPQLIKGEKIEGDHPTGIVWIFISSLVGFVWIAILATEAIAVTIMYPVVLVLQKARVLKSAPLAATESC